jgi:hypothetical protein
MIVDDLDLFGPICRPAETDTPLPVDPDAKLPSAIPLQGLKLISWWRAQFIEAHCRIEHIKLAGYCCLKSSPLTRANAITEESLSRPIGEAPDHVP